MLAPFIQFAFIDAVWTGDNREACLPQDGGHSGACWAYVEAYFPQFIYGRYPVEERYRVDIVYALFALLLVPLAGAGYRGVSPWRSRLDAEMPIIKMFSIIFIEFWRGVPLITVLFMSSVMLPLFLPEGVTFDKLLRVLIGVRCSRPPTWRRWSAAVCRRSRRASMRRHGDGADLLADACLIILPQALKLVIPGIVNTFIGLFKDTSLVLIIGLFDLLGIVQSNMNDPTGFHPAHRRPALSLRAFVFFIFCFGMSRYSHLYGEEAGHRATNDNRGLQNG
jgi:general L-amino acid transport system permease protein